MSSNFSELRQIYEELVSGAKAFEQPDMATPIQKLEDAASLVGKAWGQSWLGYQSHVYYQELQTPPAGAHFSSEWGLRDFYSGTLGDWQEFPPGAIEAEIARIAGHPDISGPSELSARVRELFEQKKDDAASILRTEKDKSKDTFLEKQLEEVEKIKIFGQADYIDALKPQGQLMSRDMLALTQGFRTPPHVLVLTEVLAIRAPKIACENLAKIVRRCFSHIERREKSRAGTERVGTNVFIGHGRSKEWKDLKDFIQDRMRLPWDEFNRVPVAGIPNAVRLSTMLDAAAIAFLVLTAEDETADGKLQARMNVIHEAGLFQGRLGFERAIVMLEEGCEEFSNIAGLGQIRFPKHNVKAAFHEVQLVLEREGLINSPEN